MAQQVVIAGAMFEDVPSISVPDANNVYHPFLDTTIASNAAAASDIAQGKLAYVNGSLVTGTNQGGGGGSLILGAIRPDAELVKSWSYDKYIHEDEGVTIPSYSTSSTTLKAAGNLETVTLDVSSYRYLVVMRGLAIPTYSISTIGKGRLEYAITSHVLEITSTRGNSFVAPNGAKDSSSRSFNSQNMYMYAYGYWTDSTTFRGGVNTSNNGCQCSYPSYSSTYGADTASINIKSPSLVIKGSTTYYVNTYMNATTDIRYQYIIELYRAPIGGMGQDGWAINSLQNHVVDCVVNNNGTLT